MEHDYPRDEWIVGDSPLAHGQRREYVIHTKPPRFIARVVMLEDSGIEMESEMPADVISGITFDSGEGFALCEIAWLDPAPEEQVDRLLSAASDVVLESADTTPRE